MSFHLHRGQVMKGTISVTEAVRNFADFINRVAYRGEHFVLERGGRPVARLVPVPQAGRLGDLPGLLGNVPALGPEEADAFARDMEDVMGRVPPLAGGDPWES
jgi:prevent-host-death family protein